MNHIRDPLHGSIPLSLPELRLVDSPFFQRLRNIKQLGFADLAFPGATHTRYLHSVGAMHLGSRLFDVLFPDGGDAAADRRAQARDLPELPAADRTRLRQAVRLALLFHDVGHAPLSHTTEGIMPPVRALGLPAPWDAADRQATHEDYTVKILVDSTLAAEVNRHVEPCGLRAVDVADLVSPVPGHHARAWTVEGLDYGPLLRQLVSSELDADRMDYLRRDSFFCGVAYGQFDLEWLVQNVVPVRVGSAVHLGLHARAIFSFEDFLLSRHHMFLTVYHHHTPVCFGEMLERYFSGSPGEYAISADVEAYAQDDDAVLWTALRRSQDPWARRICARRGFRVLKETRHYNDQPATPGLARLHEAGIEAFEHTSRGVLSKYHARAGQAEPTSPAIYVVDDAGDRTPLETYTPLYRRYADAVLVHRVYVDPDHLDRARRLLA
jgi:hypothetical protein